MGPVDLPFVEALERSSLDALLVDHSPGTRSPQHDVVLDHPRGAAVHLSDVRHTILEGCGRPLRPKVVPFRQMCIGVDDPYRVESVSHRNSPLCHTYMALQAARQQQPMRKRRSDHITCGGIWPALASFSLFHRGSS